MSWVLITSSWVLDFRPGTGRGPGNREAVWWQVARRARSPPHATACCRFKKGKRFGRHKGKWK